MESNKNSNGFAMGHSVKMTIGPLKWGMALLLLVFWGWSDIMAQTPTSVNIRNASLQGRSMEYWGNSRSACLVPLADDSNPKQQWIMVNAGGGSFYLKNVYAEAQEVNPYLSVISNSNWIMTLVSESDLSTPDYFYRARFSLVDLGDGTWGIKTMSAKNDADTHYYTYIGVDAPTGTDPDYTIWGDKLVTAYGHWTIDGLSTISISRSAGQITITASNTTDATVYYTTDGTDPTTSATRQVYSAPFTDDDYALVKAIVMKDNRPNSELVSLFNYDKKFVFQHLANNAFYLTPGVVVDGSDYQVNTYSLARPNMLWKITDASNGDYYIQNDSLGCYLSCNSSGDVRLKETNDNSDDFKFRLRLGVDGNYRLEPRSLNRNYIHKANNYKTDAVGKNDGKLDVKNYWSILPADHIPQQEIPFQLSDNTTTHYYKIQNIDANTYYLIPPTGSTGNAQYVNTSNTEGDNMLWYIKQASTDDWLTYYHIINAVTGEYLYYREAIDGNQHYTAFTTMPLSDIAPADADRCQFAIPWTGSSPSHSYIVPKVVRYLNNRVTYNIAWGDNSNPIRLTLSRESNASSWDFVASDISLMPPYFTQSASDNTLTIATTTTGAIIRYTTDGSEPTASSPVYSAAVTLTESITTVKAIAIKDGNTSSVSTWVVRPLSGTTHQYLIAHKASEAFYMIPGYVNNGNWTLNSYSLMRPSMVWNFLDAGIEEGVQYYHLRNDSTGYYVSCNANGNVYLKSPTDFGDGSADDYKFRLNYNNDDGSWWMMSKARTGYWLSKGDDNGYNQTVGTSTSTTSNDCRWKIFIKGQVPAEILPFTLSTDACASYVRIKNANATAYYIIPPTGSSVYASTSNAGGVNDRWFIREVSNDDWLTYYSIINASTGQCLMYNGAISSEEQSNAFGTALLSASEMASNERAQFVIARTTQSSSEGYYYIVPKSIRYLNDGSYYNLVWRDNNNPLKTQLQRGDKQRKWIFDSSSFICEDPVFSYDPFLGMMTLTSPNNAPIYYIGYSTGDPSITPATATLYTGPFFVGQNTHFKAIAARCTDGSDASTVVTYNLDAPFRCAQPVISFDAGTHTVTITSATTSATIYYILGDEGSFSNTLPNFGGTVYNSPFILSEPTVVRAIAVRNGDWNTVSVETLWDEAPHYVNASSEMIQMGLNYVANPGFIVDATVGTELAPFTGTFDGVFQEIALSRPLFGVVYGATIKNVKVSSASVSGSGNVGALVNEAAGATRIYNCGVIAGNVSSTDAAAGGLVGHIVQGSGVHVVNCYNFAMVSGSTHASGIVGWNESSVDDGTRIAMCMMYGKVATTATNRSPVYYGGHVSNVSNYTDYNYWRFRAYASDETPYTAYNDQLAISDDLFLDRFPFYRHILNTHRDMAAFFVFHDSRLDAVETATAPTANEVAEIGHWVLDENIAPYPIIEPWPSNTTQVLSMEPAATTADYAGKLLTEMGSNGELAVTVKIGSSTYNVNLPITDMDTLNYDFTWGKVVLPFANEFSGWTHDYSKVCTGWKITSITGGTEGTFANYNFADRNCTAKDLYSNSHYIFAQGGYFVVPYGVTAITIEAHFANAFYLSDAQSDFGYNADYTEQTPLGWTMPTSYHGQTVYTSLSTLVNALAITSDPHQQAIVLVGNYHYNHRTIGGSCLNVDKAVTIMSVDDDNNQEPDYGWYVYMTASDGTDNSRLMAPSLRFDFVPIVGIGMSARVTNSTPVPSVSIIHTRGSFEITETCVSYMSECEIASSNCPYEDDGNGNNRWVVNSGYFVQIVRSRKRNCSNNSYLKIGGNAYVKELYPGAHTDENLTTTLRPIIVTGGEIAECYMTGYRAGSGTTGNAIQFWCAGGRIHKWLGAYLETVPENVNLTAKIDHARIYRFFGGGTSASAPITGNIDIAIDNSFVDFYCGGPEFGDMAAGKTLTTHATGTTFGTFYGAGFGGTSITYNRVNQTLPDFNNDQTFFSLSGNSFNSIYKRLQTQSTFGLGVNYKFEFMLYSGGNGTGVARSYTGYARFSLAKTGNVTNVLNQCTVLNNFYGAGCQGEVDGTVTSTLTDCVVHGSVFGGGYRAENNTLSVYPATAPTSSVYKKEMAVFTDFGVVEPETWTWKQGTLDTYSEGQKELYTNVNITDLGVVTNDISLTIEGNSTIMGSVFGGGHESRSQSNTFVHIKDRTKVFGNIYGGGNMGEVGGNTKVIVNGQSN